jgi:hypothetical protein
MKTASKKLIMQYDVIERCFNIHILMTFQLTGPAGHYIGGRIILMFSLFSTGDTADVYIPDNAS